MEGSTMLKMLLVPIVVCCAYAFAGTTNPFEKRTPFQEATITYKISGTSEGTSTLYVKAYGNYLSEHEQTTMSMFGMDKKTDRLTLVTPEWIYTVDLDTRTGTKVSNFETYMQQEYTKLSPKEQKTVRRNARKMGTDFSRGLGGRIKFNAAMIHGYSCDKTTIAGMTSYTIHNTAVVLKMEGSVMGMSIKKEAVSIDKGAVGRTHFKLPENINITYDASADAMMKKQAAEMMQRLLHPLFK